jgi:hypothetical protein
LPGPIELPTVAVVVRVVVVVVVGGAVVAVVGGAVVTAVRVESAAELNRCCSHWFARPDVCRWSRRSRAGRPDRRREQHDSHDSHHSPGAAVLPCFVHGDDAYRDTVPHIVGQRACCIRSGFVATGGGATWHSEEQNEHAQLTHAVNLSTSTSTSTDVGVANRSESCQSASETCCSHLRRRRTACAQASDGGRPKRIASTARKDRHTYIRRRGSNWG